MTRKLTPEEIDDILSPLKPNPYIPKEIAASVLNMSINTFRNGLEKYKIYPELIPVLKEKILKDYLDSQMQPGECVGIPSGQNICEKQTQGNLNTFHKAGSSDKQPVTSMFAELLNTTKESKNPQFIVYFKEKYESIENIRKALGNTIVQISLAKIIKSYELCTENSNEPWYEAYFILENTVKKSDLPPSYISVNVDMTLLYTYKITLKSIADFFNNCSENITCVYSPDCYAQLHIYSTVEELDIPEQIKELMKEEEITISYLEDVVLPNILCLNICGITGIENIFFLKEKEEWILETQNTREKPSTSSVDNSASRFKKILAHPCVDETRTISNNVWDIYKTLGIEAARQFMIEEFAKIMDSINICHIKLLVEKMTFTGIVCSITRYTMRLDRDREPLGKATFEEAVDHMRAACITGSTDNVREVSASIICASRANLGTGLCSLKMDLETIKEEITKKSTDLKN